MRPLHFPVPFSALLFFVAILPASCGAQQYSDWCAPDDTWCRSLFFGGPPCPPALSALDEPLTPATTPELEQLFEDLPGFLEELRVASGSPAASLMVVQGGQVMWTDSLGDVRVDGSGGLPSANTGFRVASITKVFTSFLLYALRDLGMVSVEDPLTRWLPSFAPVQERAWEQFPEDSRRNITLGDIAMHVSLEGDLATKAQWPPLTYIFSYGGLTD